MSNLWVDIASDNCTKVKFFKIVLFIQALDQSIQSKIIQNNGFHKG